MLKYLLNINELEIHVESGSGNTESDITQKIIDYIDLEKFIIKNESKIDKIIIYGKDKTLIEYVRLLGFNWGVVPYDTIA